MDRVVEERRPAMLVVGMAENLQGPAGDEQHRRDQPDCECADAADDRRGDQHQHDSRGDQRQADGSVEQEPYDQHGGDQNIGRARLHAERADRPQIERQNDRHEDDRNAENMGQRIALVAMILGVVGDLAPEKPGYHASPRNGAGCSSSIVWIAARVVSRSRPCLATRSSQSARMASASCIIFSRLKLSSRCRPMLIPTTSYRFKIWNGKSRSWAQSSRWSEW